MGLSRQERWSGWPRPPPGDLPDPGIEPESLPSPALAGEFFTAESQGKPKIQLIHVNLGFLSGSAVKNPPVMQELQELQLPSLGGEDPLEEGVATHSRVLAWRIPMDGGAWWATVHGVVKGQTRVS